MPISYVNVAHAYVSTSTPDSLVVSAPSGCQVNDLMVVMIVAHGAVSLPAISNPAGWTQIGSDITGGSSMYRRIRVLWRRWQTGDTSWTWTCTMTSGTLQCQGQVIAFRGVDTTTAVDASNTANGTSGTTITVPTFNTTVANTMLLFFTGAAFTSARTFSAETANSVGMTEADDYSGGSNTSGTAVSYLAKAASGATGSFVATINSSNNYLWWGFALALRPVAGTIYTDTITLAGASGLAQASVASLVGNVTMAGATGIPVTSNANQSVLVALAAASGMQQQAPGSFNHSLNLAAASALVALGGLSFQALVTLAGSTGISASAAKTMQAALTLAGTATCSPSGILVMTQAIQLLASSGLPITVTNLIQTLVQLNASSGMAQGALRDSSPAIILSSSSTLTVVLAGGAVYDVALTLGAAAGLTANHLATLIGTLTLAGNTSLALNNNQLMAANLILQAASGLDQRGGFDYQAALLLAGISGLVTDGSMGTPPLENFILRRRRARA